jgi:phage-related protein
MTINGINISTLKAKLLSRSILPASKTVLYEFLNDKSLNPVKTNETAYQYKSIDLVITINAEDEAELESLKSQLTNMLQECDIEFDDLDCIYSGYLSGEIKTESISSLIENINIKILVLAHGKVESQTISNSGSTDINIQGTAETPCTLIITAPIGMISLQIDGAARDPVTGDNESILIKNLTNGVPIIIDGEACTVTENGTNKFGDCEMWRFPSLLPGNNTITLNAECTVQVTYKPRYI